MQPVGIALCFFATLLGFANHDLMAISNSVNVNANVSIGPSAPPTGPPCQPRSSSDHDVISVVDQRIYLSLDMPYCFHYFVLSSVNGGNVANAL